MSSREREDERQREEGRENPQPTVSVSINGFLGTGCYGDASIELEQGLVEDDLVNSVGSTEECPASSPEFQ